MPLAIAAATRVGGELAAYLVVPIFGALAVLACYALGAMLHSRLAGLVAATLMATSPVFLFQLVQPMSDVPAAALWASAFVLAQSRVRGAPLAAGAAAGFALLMRPNLLPLALVVGAAVAGWRRAPAEPLRPTAVRVMAFAAGLLPAIGVQVWLQWRLYGSPLASGYVALGELYAVSNVWPNVRGYVSRLLTGEGPAIALAVASLVALALMRRRLPPPPSPRPLARLAAAATVGVLLCYLAYGVFTEWSYLRFLLPAFPPAFGLVGALVASALLNAPMPVRGLALLVLLAAAGATNVTVRHGNRHLPCGVSNRAIAPPAGIWRRPCHRML